VINKTYNNKDDLLMEDKNYKINEEESGEEDYLIIDQKENEDSNNNMREMWM